MITRAARGGIARLNWLYWRSLTTIASTAVAVVRTARARRRTLLLLAGLAALAWIGAANPAAACTTATATCPDPTGLSGQLVAPDLQGSNQPTLFEAYNSDYFMNVDTNLGGMGDVGWEAMGFVVMLGMTFIVFIVRGCLVLAQWITGQNVFGDLLTTVGEAVSRLATAVFWPLLPVSLGLGVMIAFGVHRRERGGFNEFAWVAVTGLLAVTLIANPTRWLTDANTARASLASAATGALADAGGDTLNGPVPASPTYNGDARTEATRKVSDAIWRTYVVTPWCLAEFGSLRMCQLHGKEYLDAVKSGTDPQKEMVAITSAHDPNSTSDATAHWMVGKNAGRLGILLLALVTTLPFAVLILSLAIGALMAVILGLALSVLGCFFLLGWPIKGRTRQWAHRWFTTLLGAFVQAFSASVVLALALFISGAILSLTQKAPAQYGYTIVTIINLAATFTAFRYRRLLDSIMEIATPGHMSPLVGGLASMGVIKAASFAGGLVSRVPGRGALSRFNRDPKRDRKAGTDSRQETVTGDLRRMYRPPTQLDAPAYRGLPPAADSSAAALPGGPPGPRPLSGGAYIRPAQAALAPPRPDAAGDSSRVRPRPKGPSGEGWVTPRPVTVRRYDPQTPAGPRTRAATRGPRPARPAAPVRMPAPVLDVVPARVIDFPAPARPRRHRRG